MKNVWSIKSMTQNKGATYNLQITPQVLTLIVKIIKKKTFKFKNFIYIYTVNVNSSVNSSIYVTFL